MKLLVLDLCTLWNHDVSLAPLESMGEVNYDNLLSEDELIKKGKEYEGFFCNRTVITRKVIENCPNLRYIGLFATGFNNVDIVAAMEHGITVCNVPGYSTSAVAQQTFAFILELSNNVSKYNKFVHDNRWEYSAENCFFKYPNCELDGKTLGVLGMGSIGSRVAKLGEAFGMNVIYSSHSDKNNGCEFVELNELFKRSDFLSVHVPLNDETREIVNKKTLSLMKPTAFLINTSRGAVIDENALCDALNEGKIAGAAIDVVTNEPCRKPNKLLEAKNLIISPHISWIPIETRNRLMEMVAENFKAFEKGNPTNKVN